jgi:dTDP-4-amino-4,6-dideoxygalactose transaminase
MTPTASPWPCYEDDEIATVVATLRSGRVNYWTGDQGRRFEAEYAAFTRRRHGIAVANGTLALELGLLAWGIGPGDEVLTPARTYVASASCIVARGARPVVVDVDRDSQVVTVETLEAARTPRTRAAVVVHLAGWPCAMDGIMAWGRTHGIRVIEDCAQAHGAEYDGVPVGGFGDAAAFSFCQDKIISTGGEGGMLVLDDDDAWRRAWAYKDIGRDFDAVHRADHPPGFRWVTYSFGSNWRLTEMQSAIGSLQLQKLPGWVAGRNRHAGRLSDRLSGLRGLRIPRTPQRVRHAGYRYYAFVEQQALGSGWTRDRIMLSLNGAGVPCTVGSCSEVYLERAFTDACLAPPARLPVARELGETSLAFPIHHNLSDEYVDWVGDQVAAILAQATGLQLTP